MRALHLLLIGLFLLPLPACINVAATGANLFYDRSNVSNSVENVYDSKKASLALKNNKALKESSYISAVSFNNTLLLIGQAPTPQLRQLALNIVKKYVSVASIANNIEVKPPLSSNARLQDSWITTRIVSQLSFNFAMNPRAIKIVTEDGVVYILGNLTEKQATLATNVARRTPGVKKVVQLIRYIYYL